MNQVIIDFLKHEDIKDDVIDIKRLSDNKKLITNLTNLLVNYNKYLSKRSLIKAQ